MHQMKNHVNSVDVQYWKIILGIVIGCAVSFWAAFLHVGHFFTLLISAVLFFAAYFLFLLALKEPMIREIMDMVKAYFDKGKQTES